MDSHTPDACAKSLGQYFGENLCAALAIGGRQRESGAPGPVTATCMHRETGIARSTLRALTSTRTELDPNPDLHTLNRIAHALGVPPAFLLMRPQDWLALGQAVGDSADYLAAAVKLQSEGKLDQGNPVEKVLRECKVHPDARPIGVGASPEVSRVNARDEWRRRSCLKLDALMLRHVRSAQPRAWLAAIAGALVNRSTPHNPTITD
ncbi:transcriptional regulator [Pseudomonas sp. S35]|uniref:helix-turn-helix domain-containing protein n=1 Tax=Pseudomonas sp. S35 TaxID=1573719 RepID=UPI00132ED406|nr:helix-turn-helix transcriptional regulator [Pseudomonas sp. S35]QHF44369.1 transcriptional regulator [Pseudomonas sp. S35]